MEGLITALPALKEVLVMEMESPGSGAALMPHRLEGQSRYRNDQVLKSPAALLKEGYKQCPVAQRVVSPRRG